VAAAGSANGGDGGEVAPTVTPEAEALALLADNGADPEARVAAGVLAIRSCFFSTNYEGGLLAAELGLAAVERAGGRLDLDAVRDRFASMDPGLVNPAIEVDERSLVSEAEIQALLWRSIGVIKAHVGDDPGALEAFDRALEEQLEPESVARLRMYRALVFVKRLHQAGRGREEIAAGRAALVGRDLPETTIETAWLQNVSALTYFQEGTLGKAFEEAVLGLRAVAPRHEPHATHLKINLISNLSVLQEVAGRTDDALRTWERFLEVSDGWGPAVMRVHRYRDAGLRLKLGDEEGAMAHYREAYEATTELEDRLHQHIVASDLGRASLDRGRPAEAVEWFERAYDSAAALGDPMSMARSVIGAGLAREQVDEGEIRRLAALSSTFPDDAARIEAALAAGGSEDLLALLPKPRTKVNIPTLFHLVFV
jgi:tetratricopeptide (TPR) repeat protein